MSEPELIVCLGGRIDVDVAAADCNSADADAGDAGAAENDGRGLLGVGNEFLID